MSGPLGLHPSAGGGMYNQYGMGQLPNPFFTAANQFIPRSFHDVIKWSRFITTQSPTTTEVIRKLSTYPITDFLIDTSQESTRKSYKKVHKSIRLKQKLGDIGFDFYTLGNVFCSIYFPIDRHVVCPQCKNSYEVNNALTKKFIQFKKYEFVGTCPNCAHTGMFKRVDTKSMDINRINIIKWKPENIAINHNPIAGESEYYYTIPGDVRRKILVGDPMFIATVPWAFIEAVRYNQQFKFDPGSIYHLSAISMGNMIDGFGVPTLLCLYSLVFYQAMLRKANEAVAAEHMTPLRMLFPQQGTPAGDPVSALSMQGFTHHITKSIQRFKQDPNQVLISPIPIGFQNMGGQGKALLVSQEIQQAEDSMLLSMGVSRELLSGTTNWTSSTVGLRLLENTMNNYVGQISELIEWINEKIAQYLGIEIVDVTLTPFRLTDNESIKPMLEALWEKGVIAPSTVLETYGIDFNDEQAKIVKDGVTKVETELQAEHEIKVAKFMRSKDLNSEQQDDNGFKQNQDQAHEIAHTIMYDTPPEERMAKLSNLRQNDETLYSTVAGLIQEMLQNQSEMGIQEEAPEGDQGAAPEKTGSEPKKPEPKEKTK